MKEWFESWFDTHYYHILYKNRDHSEAELFIHNLFRELNLPSSAKILDLACGKGRHAILVNSLGYDTTGVDLSKESIEKAKRYENDHLRFFQHDMRDPILNRTFDVVLNLFTSFGYFQDKTENITVLKSVHTYLESDGLLLIDFMNAEKEVLDIVPQMTKEVNGIEFCISKRIEADNIVKDIEFKDAGNAYHFQEKVQLLKLQDFEGFLDQAGFDVINRFGNYQLDLFELNSDRLILLAKKRGK